MSSQVKFWSSAIFSINIGSCHRWPRDLLPRQSVDKKRRCPPPGVIINELASIPESLNRAHTNVVNEYLLQTTHSVGKVYHVSQFDIANMSGFFNIFGTRFRMDCITNAVSEINSSMHISRPADLYGQSFPFLSTKTYKKCREIHHRTLKMLRRRGQ
jgi:hypothetical protein